MLQIDSKFNEKALKKTNSFASILPNTTISDQLVPIISIVLHGKFKAVQFPDNLKPIRKDPFKIKNKPEDVLTLYTRRKYIWHR